MMVDIELDIDLQAERLQWRGSHDAIVWTPWHDLPSLRALVPPYTYYQGRIWVDGAWRTSQVCTG